jgi:ubiquinone/menaquinone biosynthesis C-methylase UbiE
MQTRGEAALVAWLLRSVSDGDRLLNLGAGQSVTVENQLAEAGLRVVIDRVDVEDPVVSHRLAGETWVASADAMSEVPSATYDAVFANYVFEHLPNIDGAIAEVRRVLKPGGLCVVSVPNPSAPQFRIAARTSTTFHKLIRGQQSWEVAYGFKTPGELARRFESADFNVEAVELFPQTYEYLRRFPVAAPVAKRYDTLVEQRGWRRLMGDACLALRPA